MNTVAVAVTSLSLAAVAFAHSEEPLPITRSGSVASVRGPAQNFTGTVRVETPFAAQAPGRAQGALVTFEPGARTAWHTHPLGQTLIVTRGTGLVQRWGGAIQEIHAGDVVAIPAGVKHWHGAAVTETMSHIAIAEALDGKSVEWLEQVDDSQYGGRPQ
jgi:quercetin dioxygenase-like cupin family protein